LKRSTCLSQGLVPRPPSFGDAHTGEATNQRQPLISIKDVSLTYGNFQALTDGSVDFYQGELVGLVGDNGAGKTTLIRIISGIIAPTSGEHDIFQIHRIADRIVILENGRKAADVLRDAMSADALEGIIRDGARGASKGVKVS
jgi:ABC-type sugar transport system ATPase subunit